MFSSVVQQNCKKLTMSHANVLVMLVCCQMFSVYSHRLWIATGRPDWFCIFGSNQECHVMCNITISKPKALTGIHSAKYWNNSNAKLVNQFHQLTWLKWLALITQSNSSSSFDFVVQLMPRATGRSKACDLLPADKFEGVEVLEKCLCRSNKWLSNPLRKYRNCVVIIGSNYVVHQMKWLLQLNCDWGQHSKHLGLWFIDSVQEQWCVSVNWFNLMISWWNHLSESIGFCWLNIFHTGEIN